MRSTSRILPYVEIRTATVDDALAVETVRVTSWKLAYRGVVPDAYLDAMVVDAARRVSIISAGAATTLLALEDGAPVGMAAFGPSRDDDLEGLELFALYVLPDAWRTGVGTALLTASGTVRSVWVLENNEPAQAFYARHGFVRDGVSTVLDLGAPLTELRMVRYA
jgi:ribosomal protein S18 acetylase RimI-like enzyme